MSPHYDRTLDHPATQQFSTDSSSIGGKTDDDALVDAAEALRQAEVEAVVPDLSSLDASQLEHMTIDELRAVAKALDVPGRAQIIEQDELIDAIRRYL